MRMLAMQANTGGVTHRRARATAVTLTAGMLLTLAGFFVAGTAQAAPTEESDEQEKPWQETALRLPAAPQAQHLLPLDAGRAATQTFAIDAQSVSTGADGTVRYTLVATSAAGATNVSYEAIRCATWERKRYAFGRPDGIWSPARRDQWERIDADSYHGLHAMLAREFFCTGKIVAGSTEEIVQRIRQKKPLAP